MKPLADVNADSFDLKSYLALKMKQRESRIKYTNTTTANRIVKTPPSQLNTSSMGNNDDEVRQEMKAMRSNAADRQQNRNREGKYVTDPVVGSRLR